MKVVSVTPMDARSAIRNPEIVECNLVALASWFSAVAEPLNDGLGQGA